MSVVILPETSFIGPNQLFSFKPQCIWRRGGVRGGAGRAGGGSKRV